jgi:glycosyltransferase involved in cell wall biosynthesis
MSEKQKPNLLIIGNLHSHPSAEAFLSKFMRIMEAIAGEVYIISGDKPPNLGRVQWLKPRYETKRTIIGKIVNLSLTQLNAMLMSIKVSKKVDIVIVLPTSMVFPIIALKLMNKKTIVFAAQKNDNILMRLFGQLSFLISDLIIVESNGVINDLHITKHNEKIVKGNIYVDIDSFKRKKFIHERGKVVGYIGILDKRKGSEKLIEAISKVAEKDSGIEFLIGGIGPLEGVIKSISSTDTNVKFKGFVPQDDLPKHFNDMKLFVLPSISEGLPNVILEAMACGTPVLATPVGAIPDVIKDGETGFIMENNSPECIAENVIRALEHANLDEIVRNALRLIEEEYTIEVAVERYTKVIELCTSY